MTDTRDTDAEREFWKAAESLDRLEREMDKSFPGWRQRFGGELERVPDALRHTPEEERHSE